MFIAAYKGHKECIEVLARLGGNVNATETVSVCGRCGLLWVRMAACAAC
mgnify:CR=1 FL=1